MKINYEVGNAFQTEYFYPVRMHAQQGQSDQFVCQSVQAV